MARTCEAPAPCRFPVFGTDKNTGKGFCKKHQYMRTDLKRGINKVGRKGAERTRAYNKVREVFFETPRNKVCLAFLLNVPSPTCTHVASEAHHSEGRDGENMTDIKKFKGLCHNCHDWYQIRPAEAEKYGITKTKFGSNEQTIPQESNGSVHLPDGGHPPTDESPGDV